MGERRCGRKSNRLFCQLAMDVAVGKVSAQCQKYSGYYQDDKEHSATCCENSIERLASHIGLPSLFAILYIYTISIDFDRRNLPTSAYCRYLGDAAPHNPAQPRTTLIKLVKLVKLVNTASRRVAGSSYDHQVNFDPDPPILWNLTPAEIRVAGCLVEKQLTTPQHYPLTLNALHAACNQASNRDPVVSWDAATVEAAVTSLKQRGLARFVHPSHGRSAVRYCHAFDEAIGLTTSELALIAVLMLRGPQTPGELRMRTDRMAGFTGLAEIEATLAGLGRSNRRLVVRLERRPGQKEDRYMHALAGETSPEWASPPPGMQHSAPTSVPLPDDEHMASVTPEREATMAQQLDTLADQVRLLRRDLDEVRAALGIDETRHP